MCAIFHTDNIQIPARTRNHDPRFVHQKPVPSFHTVRPPETSAFLSDAERVSLAKIVYYT
jgi:hypothetical protein